MSDLTLTPDNQTQEILEQISEPSFWSRLNAYEILKMVITVVLIYAIGSLVIKLLSKIINRLLTRSGVSKSAVYYIDTIIKFMLYFVLITITANSVGIQTGSLVALVASLGLAIALALRGSLTDLASGIMIIITRTIIVGDRVFVEGYDDYLEVVSIRLFNTQLRSRKNIILTVPNEYIMQKRVENLKREEYVLADVEIGVDYHADTDRVKGIIRQVLEDNPKVLNNKPHILGIKNLADSEVVYLVSAPVMAVDYFIIQLELREEIFNALKANGISIPFPQREVKIIERKDI